MSGVLLDTCAMIWIADGWQIGQAARGEIVAAALGGGVFVSPVSAWEVSAVAARGRFADVRTQSDARRWSSAFMSRSGILPAPFTAEIALQSAMLPQLAHRDPADRFLIATARVMTIPIVTRDGRIIDYGRRGHVKVIPC